MLKATRERLECIEDRLEHMELRLEREKRQREFGLRLNAAAQRGAMGIGKPGTRVQHLFRPGPAVVIPRPYCAKELAARGDTLIYIMWEDGSVRGCWPENVVRR